VTTHASAWFVGRGLRPNLGLTTVVMVRSTGHRDASRLPSPIVRRSRLRIRFDFRPSAGERIAGQSLASIESVRWVPYATIDFSSGWEKPRWVKYGDRDVRRLQIARFGGEEERTHQG
jgi:hypothetical protein